MSVFTLCAGASGVLWPFSCWGFSAENFGGVELSRIRLKNLGCTVGVLCLEIENAAH